MKVKTFEDLIVWQKARIFCNDIYLILNTGSLSKDYSLREQLNKASGSIMDNIAEGYERDGKNEFLQFLSIAKASAGEVRSQLYRAFDRGHIGESEFNDKKLKIEEISRLLSGFIKHIKSSDIKGLRYKTSEPSVFYNLKLET